MRILLLTALLSSAMMAASSQARQASLVYANFFGGSDSDAIEAMTTDAAGNLYIAGASTSRDFPNARPLPGGRLESQFRRSLDGGLTWSNYSDLPAGPMYALAVHPRDSSTMLAGGYSTVYKSTDGGKTWRDTRATFPEGTVFPPPSLGIQPPFGIHSVAYDPRDPSIVYAAREPGGVIKSVDGGENWSTANTGLRATGQWVYASSIAVDGSRAFAITSEGLFRSTDRAVTWTQVQGLPTGIGRVVLHPRVADRVYVIANGALFRSDDGGNQWKRLTADFGVQAPSLAFDPVQNDTVYVVQDSAVMRSVDAGASFTLWKSVGIYVNWIAAHPQRPGELLIQTFQGLYRLTPDGALSRVLHASLSNALVYDPALPNVVYYASNRSNDLFVAKLSPGGDQVLWTTMLGGSVDDHVTDLKVDGDGNVVVAGYTLSSDFPLTENADRATMGGMQESFVLKLAPAGDRLVYSTYVSGYVTALALDGGGSAYLTGYTSSPTQIDAFVTKFAADGALVYSKAIGGSRFDQAWSIAVDSGGNAIIVGSTESRDFPATAGAYQTVSRGSTGFVAKVNAQGTELVWSTFLGGTTGTDRAMAVVLDAGGQIVVAGSAGSSDFPTTEGAYQRAIRSEFCQYSLGCAPGCIGPSLGTLIPADAFVARLSADGSTLLSSTLFGGQCALAPRKLELDAQGRAWVAASTRVSEFPLRDAVVTRPVCGEFATILARLSASSSELEFATYFDTGDRPSLALDRNGNVFAAGATCPGAAVTSGPFRDQSTSVDGYLARVEAQDAGEVRVDSLANAFSLEPSAVAAGELVAVRGAKLTSADFIDFGLNPERTLPEVVNGVRVYFDEVAAQLMLVSADRIVCVVPASVAGKRFTLVRVDNNGERSNVVLAPVAASAPGLLSLDGSGRGQANARNEDGTLNSASNPARRGSVVTFYVTGAQADGVRVRLGSSSEIIEVSTMPGFVPSVLQARVRLGLNEVTGAAIPVSVGSGVGRVTVAIE